jgi:glycosyltransferase involved in cell wall biosynthesis
MILSICIPTRNRQFYCTDAVRHMLATQSKDFEVVIADNSDNPEDLPTRLRDNGLINDPRLKLLPSASDKVYSMRENWERAHSATEGEWVGFIGDDDYLDPKATVFLEKINKSYSNVDYIRWDRPLFDWPDNRTQFTTIKISLINEIRKLNPQKTQSAILSLNDGQSNVDGFSPYHAFTKRKLIDKVVSSQGGRYFFHPMVDYVTGYKQAFLSEGAIYSFRPFSVVGASKPSNSASVRNIDSLSRSLNIFLYECTKEDHDWLLYRYYKKFFDLHKTVPGLGASIFLSLLDFLETTDKLILSDRSPVGLIKIIEKECEAFYDERNFNKSVEINSIFLKDFISENNLRLFNPKFREKPREKVFIGLLDNYLYVANDFTNAQSAGELYMQLEKMLCPIDRLGISQRVG